MNLKVIKEIIETILLAVLTVAISTASVFFIVWLIKEILV